MRTGRSRTARWGAFALSTVVLTAPHPRVGLVMAVDKNKFRKCSDTGFCRRNRGGHPQEIPFRISPGSIVSSAEGISAKVMPGGGESVGEELFLTVNFYSNGACRVKMTEAPPAPPRYEPPDVFLEEGLVLVPHHFIPAGSPNLPEPLRNLPEKIPEKILEGGMGEDGGNWLHIAYGEHIQSGGVSGGHDLLSVVGDLGQGNLLSIRLDPFKVDLFVKGEAAMSVNERGMMHFEQHRERGQGVGRKLAQSQTVDVHGGKTVADYGEDGLAIYTDGSKETQESHQRRLREAHTSRGADGDGDNDSEDDKGLWEETFDGHPDSKPHGPTSVGVDISFPGSRNVYGIPEHASSMSLKCTRGEGAPYSEPYRLYNLDVFEYQLDVPSALYGSIPLMLSHRAGGVTVGAFWLNPTETFIDVEDVEDGPGALGAGAEAEVVMGKKTKKTHWISEGGALDLVMLPGPTPREVFRQYSDVSGKPDLPPLFSLGLHQCRWNYKDEKDVLAVDAGFEEFDFPYDVIWLDIEHTHGKRYFTWDKALFPDPKRMIDKVAAHGRRMVTIVDPHIKRDNSYAIHKEATAKGYYIKDKDGKDFDGWCWPGQSSYLDFTDEKVRTWWASRFALDKYEGSTLDLYTWNDMNEPSVFNGPEVSMKKDCLNLQGVEHRHWHNTYGMLMQRATAEGLVARTPDKNLRPFVLSRAFFAGSQRWGAVWTGDNAARWDHLAISSPMLLTLGLTGLPFVGADVGGFFGDPSPELFLRWMQVGAYQPFFRNHAHHDSRRREPWVQGDPWTELVRAAVLARYSLLPYWYTTFKEASETGMPVMRPMWVGFPEDENTFDMDDQWLVGPDLLVKPVVSEGKTTVDVYLPRGQCSRGPEVGDCLWYDVDTMVAVPGAAVPVTVAAPLEKIPVFQRGGSIVPRKMRVRRSSRLMARDPYTLVAALDRAGMAEGRLYLDDGETYDYKRNTLGAGWAARVFRLEGGVLRGGRVEGSGGGYVPENIIERVVVAGLSRRPSAVTLVHRGKEVPLNFDYEDMGGVLTVRNPRIPVVEDFEIRL